MKKIVLLTLVLVLALGAFTACGKDDKKDDKEVIKVGASITPHAEILSQIKDNLAEKGYELEIVEYNDYVLPNTSLESGELDANFFQHQPYLDDFNKENGTHLVSVAKVHFEPFGIYAGKTDDLSKLADGAKVAVPNDSTNEARALLLLEVQGLIKLKENVGIAATVQDIVENPKNLEIVELEAAQIPRVLQDVDIACLNGNYALEANYKVNQALAVEDSQSVAAQTYGNILVVKEGNEETAKTKALKEAILSSEVKEYIEKTYEGSVVPVF